MNLCKLYAALLKRGSTAVGMIRALMLPSPQGFPPSAFVEALKGAEAELIEMDATRFSLAQRVVAAPTLQLDHEAASVVLEAYVRLAPAASLVQSVAAPLQDELRLR